MGIKEIYLTDEIEASVNSNAERGGSRAWYVWGDLASDENFVIANLGFGIFSRHPTDFSKMITELRVSLLGRSTWDGDNQESYLWSATATYGLYRPSASASAIGTLPEVRAAGTRIAKVAAEDRDGKPILNTVGDPYDPPLELDATSLTFYVMRNEPIGNLATAIFNIFARSDKVNEADWNGFPAGTLKTCTISLPKREYDPVARQYYYPMEYGFEFKPEGWKVKVLNAGYRYLDSSGKLRQALVDGSPATVPVLLTEEGEQLNPPVNQDNIVINEHELYYELDYGVFGMDDLLSTQNEPIPPPADGTGGFS